MKEYELKKDVTTPGNFWRAGIRKTEKEWREIFDFVNIQWESEWFIDLSVAQEEAPKDELRDIINSVFKDKGLHSITYKEAAREIAEKWVRYLKSEKKINLFNTDPR